MKKRIVILSGAGISAESGIQTFRDGDGLWENHRIEDVATPQAWHSNPELVMNFYNIRRKQVMLAQPNRAHQLLAELEKQHDVYIITQNVDDLHERAGSTRVLHLHGEILKKRCTINENHIAPAEENMLLEKTPSGGYWRPHIVWFGEDVPLLEKAAQWVNEADVFIVVGTSLLVYPAASLIHYAPLNCQRWIIDPKIPKQISSHFNVIESRATSGIQKFVELFHH